MIIYNSVGVEGDLNTDEYFTDSILYTRCIVLTIA